jgi:hypothetical protein
MKWLEIFDSSLLAGLELMVGPALFDGPEVSLCFGAHQCLKINRG